MTLRQYILVFFLGTLIGSIAWVLVVLNINPSQTGFFGFVVFYLTLFIALQGFFTSVPTLLRSIIYRHRNTEEIIVISLRQGFLLTILILGSLFLLSQNLLFWWSLLLMIGFLSLIEFFFISTKH